MTSNIYDENANQEAPKDKPGDKPSDVVGDPFGTRKEAAQKDAPDPREVAKFHTRSDVDSSAQAQHHTIGIKHDQASAGDHIHNGVSSRRLMENVTISGAKGGNVALTNLISALSSALGFKDNTT